MTYLMIQYDRVSDSLVATVNEAKEVKVSYNATENTLNIFKNAELLKTLHVRENLPARAFIDFCFETAKKFQDG